MNIDNKKILIAFFSHSGNTREVASQIYDEIGGDILEIQPVYSYPEHHGALLEQTRNEGVEDFKPLIEGYLYDVESYDVIFVGSPVWWYTIAPPVKTFLSENNLDGKIIVPFCTHGGSGKALSFSYIKALLPDSFVLDGLELMGDSCSAATDEVAEWLSEIGITS